MRRSFSIRVLLALVLLAGSLFHALPARGDSQVHEKILASTAWVTAVDGKQLLYGTGSLIDREQRLLVTCLHVVKDQTEATVYFPMFHQSGPVITEAKEYLDHRTGIHARVVATDSRRDLALLRLDDVPPTAAAVPLAEQAPKPGEVVYGVGNSGNSNKPLEQFSLWKLYESKCTRSVFSTQLIKNTGDIMDAWAIELATNLQPGDSGGPLIDSEGRLLGIVYGTNDDKGYAADVDEVRLLLDRFHKPLDLTGSWTVRLRVKDQPMGYLKVNFLQGGALEWVSDKKHTGRYELQEGRLTLIVPSLNINETVSIIRRDETGFSFTSANVPFTFTRR